MKDQYFGDINDYRKYGLLRCITEASGLSVGVCWMLTPDDADGDGQNLDYLDDPGRFRGFDPELYDLLGQIRFPDVPREVVNARLWDVLPDAQYFLDVMPPHLNRREEYFAIASAALLKCPILFFDPDVGIAPASARKGSVESQKWVFWDELEAAYGRGQSLVIYQHFPRRPRDQFVEQAVEKLRAQLGAPLIESFRTSHVVFFLVGQPDHVERLTGIKELVAERWNGEIMPNAAAWQSDEQPEKVECLDCDWHERRNSEMYEANGTLYCRHFSPEYWVRRGYKRDWGDAAVMNWPSLEILRRGTTIGCEFVILAPKSSRRPIILESSDPEAWGMY